MEPACLTVYGSTVSSMFRRLSPLEIKSLFHGKVEFYNGYQLVHPEYDKLGEDEREPLNTGAVIPLYPSGQKLKSVGLDSRGFRRIIKGALKQFGSESDDFLPDDLRKSLKYLPLGESIEIIHFAADLEQLSEARCRLKFDEHFFLQLLMALRKVGITEAKGRSLSKTGPYIKLIYDSLDFELTGAQKRVLKQIKEDMASSNVMNRLLQGDVGSGKTIVSILAVAIAVGNGVQAAIMAPTEILAQQHLQSFTSYLDHLGIKVAFLSGSQNTEERRAQINLIASGKAQVVIGTHALFQESVSFNNLGLVIIDEQHKFGVHQRLSLAQKAKKVPHQLVMTATPIPRSLTMSVYADLDTSVIDELPPGRQKIETIALSNNRRDEVVKRIKQVCTEGKQIYWVCTLIEESEALRAESAEKTYLYLSKKLEGIKVVMIHGRLNKTEKEIIMQDFAKEEINVLVATTVIEVGLNVPNASLMIVENAERLGLAQLHQLRGRVGRGSEKSVCVLMYQSPLSDSAKQRLDILRHSNDGFVIAQKDLELRGPGEVLGTQQTGIADMKIANIARDAYLLKQAGYYASQMLEGDEKDQHSLINRWIDSDKSHYANA